MRANFLAGAAVLLAVAAPASIAWAEPGLPDHAAVVAALDAHPAVQAAQARTSAARAEARSLARGTQEFTVAGSYVKRSVDREGRYDEYDAQLTRPIRLPGKARLDREIGDFGVTAAENMAEDARHQAALILSDAWWDWLGASAEAQVDRQAVDNFAALLTAVRRRVALRDAAQLDADQVEAALGTARVAAAQSAGREIRARARLATQFPDLALPQTMPDVPSPELPAGGLAGFHDQILARSHEIAAAEARSQMMAAHAARVRQDRLADPSVGVRLFSERNGAERGAGVLFSMPLGGGYRGAMADKADAEATAAAADLMAARNAIREVAETDMAEAQYRHASWLRSRESLNAQVAALLKLRRGHAAGEIDLADVLYAERQAQDGFRAEALARTEAMRALTRIRIDSHQLWIND